MSVYFLDSSAIIKNYLNETGSTWVRGLVNAVPRHELYVSRLAQVEVVAALARRARGGGLTPNNAAHLISQFKTHLATDFRVLEINLLLISQATTLAEKHGLRGYDAMQLAAALAIQVQLATLGLSTLGYTFIAADKELNASAQAAGLMVDDPNLHP